MGSACTSTSTSSASLPEWLTGPAAETIGRSVTQSQQPYQPYGGQLTAPINATQQQGIDVARGSQGNWAGQFGQAQDLLNDAVTAPGALASGQRYVDTGATMSSLDAANPLIAAGTGAGGLATASPFLAAASQTAPNAISSYMSPYTSGVVDEIGRLGSRNLTENILPHVNDTFIGSGQFGSDRNAMTVGRSIRDASRDIAGQQSAALQAGYGQAGQLFESDANRAAALAGTAGNLGESAASRSLTGANLAGNLTNADANRWITAGNSVAGMAGQDQQAALAASRQAASLSGQQQQQNVTDANALLAAGGVQQQTQQRADDASRSQFTEGRDWNQNQLSWLNSIIRGTPAPQTTTNSATSSPLSTGAGLASLFASFFKDGGRVRPVQDYSPLTAVGRLHLARGGYIDDEDEEDPLFPAEGDALDGGDDALDYEGGDGTDGPGLPMPQVAQATPAAAGTPPSALSILRERATRRSSDDPDLKAAMAGVDEAQKSALDRPKREKSWMDSPLALAGLSILAAPPGTSGISAIGQGALSAVKTRQAERRLDQTEDQARRMDALKVAQQRLSSILSARTNDTREISALARAEALSNRGTAPKTTATMADAEALGFDLKTPDGRKAYQSWKIGQTRAPQGGAYAPTDIEKWGAIIKDPNADPLLKDAARRALGAKGNREMSPGQVAALRGRAAALAQADVGALGKDFQFKTPEEQQAFLRDRTDKHLSWLTQGADPDAAPEPPAAPAAPPVSAAPAAAPAPAQGDPLAQATPEELQQIATDPNYPADPAMREAAKARLAASAAPAGAPARVPPPALASPTPRGDKVRDVPANMVNAMSTNAQGVRQIDKALSALDAYPDGVGAKIGAYNLIPGPALDALDPKGTNVRALIADIGSLKIHDRSGAAVTAAEFPRLKPFVPNVYDGPETIKKKLANFKSAYLEVLADQYASYGPEGGHKSNARIEEVLRGGKPAEDKGAATKTPEQKAAIMLASPKRPDGVGADWTPKLHKSSGLMGWASPDGRTFIPAE